VYAHPERYRGHPGEASVGTNAREWWGVRDDTAVQRRRAAALTRVESFVRHFHGAGGLLLTGTDGAPLPGFGLHDELALLVEAGLSPAQALRAATLNPARAFGRDARLGTVARGRFADLVLLDGDPLADVRNTRHIRLVVANGRVLDRAALDALLSARTRGGALPPS
jgi:imidazolonepropionase-like amidohydrolase